MEVSRKSLPFVASIIASLANVQPVSAQQPVELCQAVLQQTVFNTGETRSVEAFASAYRNEFCEKEWQNKEDVENRGKSFNLGYEDVAKTLDINATDFSNSTKLSSKYNDFCKKTVQDIAYSSTFYNKYRDSDVAVKAWSECIKSTASEGIFSLVTPDNGLTGALVILAVKRSGEVLPLDILSIQPAGDYTVTCNAGTTRAEDANFQAGKREQVISCIKAANKDTTFTIDTNWGTYPPIRIPGFDSTISALQADLSQLRQIINNRDNTINNLSQTVAVLKRQVEEVPLWPELSGKLAGLGQDAFDTSPQAFTSYCGQGQVAVGVEITGNAPAGSSILYPLGVHIRCAKLIWKPN